MAFGKVGHHPETRDMKISKKHKGICSIALLLLLICGCLNRSARAEKEEESNNPPHHPSAQTSEPTSPRQIISDERIHFGADLLWYGANRSRTNPQVLSTFSRLVKELGIKSVRFDVYWGLIEKDKGRFDWKLTDDLVDTVDEDTEILFTLYSTSRWGSKYNNCREIARDRRGANVYNKPPSSIPLQLEDYGNFLDRIVERYKGRVKYWQIENEVYGSAFRNIKGCGHANRFWIGTMQEYLTLLRESYLRIKRADPKATVFASSFTFEPWPLKRENPFLAHVMDEGRHYTDLLDLHLYLGIYEDPAKIDWVRKKVAALGLQKRFWSTESGQVDIAYHRNRFNNSIDSKEELKLQAEETVKRYVLAFASGVERVFHLRLSPFSDQEPADSRWSHMGLTFDKQGLKKKPGYYAMETTIRKLEGFSSIERMGPTSYRFTVRGKPVLVLWADRDERIIDVSDIIDAKTARVTQTVSLDGAPSIQAVPAERIVVGSAPVFVE